MVSKRSSVIVDTGILIALIDARDTYHLWVLEQLRNITPPMLTCEAVISETWFLLDRVRNGRPTLLQLLEREQIIVPFTFEPNCRNIITILQRYSDVPASIADAELVRMAELYPQLVVFTLDRDFQIYRKNHREIIPVISPWQSN